MNYNGSIGEAFYQEDDFWASDDVNVLYPKFDLNKEIALFIIPLIENEKFRFSFGRKWHKERMEQSILILPVDECGQPDWDYMILATKKYSDSISFNEIESVNTYNKNRMNLDDWYDFNLDDYFDMYAGRYYSADSFDEGEIPLISASDKNNGVMKYTDLEPTFKGNCITIGKVDMSTFYQPTPFCATSDVTVLQPKEKFNIYIAMFLITIIVQEKSKWSYGRQIRLNDSLKLNVKLPSMNFKGKALPDWTKIENIIKKEMFSELI